jgi:peptidoglycan/LPS O-acetylase OafA/YrhL
MVGPLHPLLLIFQVALWPLWLFFLWAYQPDPNDPQDETEPAVEDPLLPERPDRGQVRFRILWLAAIPLAALAAFQAYQIAHAPPDARLSRIISTVSALAVFAGLVLFKFFYPDRRIPRVAVVVLALILIAIAALVGHHSTSR